jgi:hypothetical protein
VRVQDDAVRGGFDTVKAEQGAIELAIAKRLGEYQGDHRLEPALIAAERVRYGLREGDEPCLFPGQAFPILSTRRLTAKGCGAVNSGPL